MSSSKSASTKKQQVTESKNKASLERAGGLDLDKVLGSLTKTTVDIQQTLGKVGTTLIEKVADLKAVEETITIKKAELEALHGADKILLGIDELKAEHEQTLQQLAKEAEEAREKMEQEKADEEERRRREEADFNYQLSLRRKGEEDRWTEQLRLRNRDEKIRQEEFDRSFALREAELAKKESDYQAALARFETIQNEIDSAVKREVSIVANAMKKDFEHEKQLTAVQHKAEIDRFTAANQNLTGQLAAAEATVRDLQAALSKAYEKNNELAAKAVDSAANTKTVADMQSLITNIGGNGARPRS